MLADSMGQTQKKQTQNHIHCGEIRVFSSVKKCQQVAESYEELIEKGQIRPLQISFHHGKPLEKAGGHGARVDIMRTAYSQSPNSLISKMLRHISDGHCDNRCNTRVPKHRRLTTVLNYVSLDYLHCPR